MILSLLIYAVALFITALTTILPAWTLWPTALMSGLTYFCSSIAAFNFFFPIDTLFSVLLFLINFEVLYFTAKVTMKAFNYFRGTGSGLDI